MQQHPVLQWIHDTWLGDVTRDNSWLFTLGLVLHFIGLCTLLGGMLVIDLRVIGVAKRIPIGGALSLLPFAIAGFALNLLTGCMFFCFDPFGYWANPAFKLKMLLVFVAGLNALVFTLTSHGRLDTTGPGYDASAPLKLSAGLSLVVWFGVIVLGRLIVAFQGSTSF